MKIATWNINSLRKRIPQLTEWLQKNEPDVMCLQETKLKDTDFPELLLRTTGYHVTFRGRTGFNGVATLSRTPPETVLHGFTEGDDAEDDRILLTVINGMPIINTYVPQGQRVGSDKYLYKLDWFHRMRQYLDQRFRADQPIVWLGDLNVAPEAIDVYHPERRVNDADFHIDARNAWKTTVAWGFTDVFRTLHPERVQYTYWDYFRNALHNNWGWRIDHILATAPLSRHCQRAEVDMESRRAAAPSDHAIVWAEFAV